MNLPITIIVDGEATLGLKWPIVPRIGEWITIGTNPEARKVYRVVHVQYHGESDPRVDLFCTEIQRQDVKLTLIAMEAT